MVIHNLLMFNALLNMIWAVIAGVVHSYPSLAAARRLLAPSAPVFPFVRCEAEIEFGPVFHIS